MQPILFEVFGFPINSYGVSKAAAAIAAGLLLAREFRRLGWNPDHAWNLVLAGTVLGFLGAKVYFLAENVDHLTAHHFGPMGFTWYGGLVAGTATVAVLAWRYRLPLGQLAGLAAPPLALAYGIGRLGCFLSGDGSYGKASDLPWAMTFPDGTMPTLTPVHPTALYEAAFAFLLAGALWWARTRMRPLGLFGLYAVASGTARFLVEEIRINPEAWAGLTQPQLWSLPLATLGIWLLLRHRRGREQSPVTSAAHEASPS